MQDAIFDVFIGKTINREALNAIGCNNGTGYGDHEKDNEFIIYSTEYSDDENYRSLFGITKTLINTWDCRGHQLNIYVYVNTDMITGGYVYKYKESYGGHFRSNIIELTPTQQELRIAKRILEYITYK